MKNIKVLLTSSGYLGGNTLVKYLKKTGERNIEVIGTDMNSNCAAKFYCDKFFITPPTKDRYFIPTLLEICQKERPDVILPAGSYDIYPLAFHKKRFEDLGIKVMVSDLRTLEISLDKAETYHRLNGIVPLPRYFDSNKGFVIKPKEGKGGRGIEVFEKQGLIMEKMEGEEVDIDVLSYNGEVLLCVPKLRERTYGGTLIEGKIVSRPYLFEQVKKIIQVIPIQFLSVPQFMGGKLLELNPRIAGAVPYFEGWNLPYLAIKLALNEITPAEVKVYQDKIPFGLKISRFLSQIQYNNE
ncbi:hypothetical protein LCGC14_2361350 [marine sediment metagenome]|uniref:PylC N-terminal domain-containing protein n=1 Tax=marine sediment metagenome TaxID=412755 RepID=A0A0F9CTV3_9ZZZZ